MNIFQTMGILTTLAAVFAFINDRYIRLQMTVGLMLLSLVFSGTLILLDHLGLNLGEPVKAIVQGIRFDQFMLQAVLSFLLFSGALFADVQALKKVKLDIALLALVGVSLSTLLVGFSLYHISRWLGLELRLIYCFLFGALISPTDPIAVIATLKRIGIGGRTEARIAGEALFNDGVGIVLFLTLLHYIGEGGGKFGAGQMLILFTREAFGGIVLGLAVGGVGFLLLRGINSYTVEILITLAMVSGGYPLAQVLEVSGPLAMVVAGLMIGSHGRTLAMSEITVQNLDLFWEVIEDILNAVLFTLIGLEIMILFPDITPAHLIIGATSILIVLLARFLSVSGMSLALKRTRIIPPHSVPLLTWAGVRGGISIALALSLPAAPERDVLIVATYMVAVFTLLVQATTVRKLAGMREEWFVE
jgi:CPA1 family monovalent cation:H+ antiporter